MWFVTSQKHGASALGLKRVLGLGSYNTAWEWLHKLRRGMVRAGRDKLQGPVEVDETYIGGVGTQVRGRGAERKAIVVIAAEVRGKGPGRIRMAVVPDVSAESLHEFVSGNIQIGSEVRTDGWSGYNGLDAEDIGIKSSISQQVEILLMSSCQEFIGWLLSSVVCGLEFTGGDTVITSGLLP
jgi:hypothetical protein